MSTEVKNTLFRFVTMRAPELSDEKQKDKRFIYRNFEKAVGPTPFDDAVAGRLVQPVGGGAMALAFLVLGSVQERAHGLFRKSD